MTRIKWICADKKIVFFLNPCRSVSSASSAFYIFFKIVRDGLSELMGKYLKFK
jgi:hypothetical protein